MNKFTVFFISLLLLLGFGLVTQPLQAQDLNSQQRSELEEINEILTSNPELLPVLHRSLNDYLSQRSTQQAVFAENRDWLFSNAAHPVLGNPDSPHKIIVFTDYNCPYCKRLEPVLEQLVAEHPSVHITYVVVPLRQQQPAGADTSSGHLALDIWRQNQAQFNAVHELLMRKSDNHTASSLESVADMTGTARYLTASAESRQAIERNLTVFTGLGLRGTPSIMVGNQMIPGFVPYPDLLEVVEAEFSL